MARPGLDPTYQPGWSLDVYCESELIGSIQDKVFRYTEAHSVRDFIGWVWASSLGRTKVLDVTSDDLDKAAASVVKAIHQSDGQVGYDWWAELMTTVYVRDKTVLYECYPYLNATLKVATRLIHGAEHPGFNVSW
jgi:hypothetical protein